MIRYTISDFVGRPPEFVYDFIVVNQERNHPRWEEEVEEIRYDGPIAPGTSGVMVRRDFGKVTEQPLEILELIPGRRSRFASDSGGVRFDCAIDIEPSGTGTQLSVTVQVTLSGAIRLLQPLLALVFQRNSRRIMKRLQVLLAEEPDAAA
jgi:hypothetical protein